MEWDKKKNKSRQKRQSVALDEAKSVSSDDNAILFEDPEHSADEERLLIIGLAESSGICIVSHCYREKESIIRIISARRATKAEKTTYRNNVK